ncbi:MAG TPA: flagellar hook-basal body complex protein FliE [Acidobacteriaceae bacterium]|jgi:flagellar hook-basal body complex protein FliE|nr:flagellar hook-basal body complex protein FliE [Acidobacteriaceae bacterium]
MVTVGVASTQAAGAVLGGAAAGAVLGGAAAGAAGSTAGSGAAPFGDLLKNAIDGVDSLEQQATTAVQGMLSGSGADVHDAMIATQKADLSFEMAAGGAKQGGGGLSAGDGNAVLTGLPKSEF